MRRHIHGIDHVVLVVNNLAAACATYERMGFTVTPRGLHTLGSSNHCIMFTMDYIELLHSPAENPHPSRAFYTDFATRGDGLAGIALATDQLRAAHTELRWAGFSPSEPVSFSRPVKGGDTNREASFRISTLALDKTPGGRIFLCEHLTREVVWRREWQSHALGATAIAAIAIVTEDVTADARTYARLFDTETRVIEPELLLVEAGNAPIAFTTRAALAKRLPQVALNSRPEPFMAALFIRVADRVVAAEVLAANGFEPRPMLDGSVAVGADRACGVALVFG
jgi:catechol 2,3-dioxygenase-like lactoylglutathione lyase family enzyme